MIHTQINLFKFTTQRHSNTPAHRPKPFHIFHKFVKHIVKKIIHRVNNLKTKLRPDLPMSDFRQEERHLSLYSVTTTHLEQYMGLQCTTYSIAIEFIPILYLKLG